MVRDISKKLSANLRLYNYIFTRPILLSWFIGTAILHIFFYTFFSSGNILETIGTTVFLFGGGLFIGVFIIWPTVPNACIRLNGGPHNKGDYVFILSGKNKGNFAKVYYIKDSEHHRGWRLLALDTGDDLLEYEVLATQRY